MKNTMNLHVFTVGISLVMITLVIQQYILVYFNSLNMQETGYNLLILVYSTFVIGGFASIYVLQRYSTKK